MKQELIFIWINNYRCLSNVGFNFSPKFAVAFDPEKSEITIKETDNINIFAHDNIMNLSAIIGENGSGKTSLLQFLNSLNFTPLWEIADKEYHAFMDKQNSEASYVAVYSVDDQIRVINKTQNLLRYGNKVIPSITNNLLNENNILDHITRIYFTNSEYADDSNMYKNDIDHISIYNQALNSVAQNFYNYTVLYGDQAPRNKWPNFDDFQRFLVQGKTSKDFQQILDILFLYRINQQQRNDEYLGKKISTVNVSFSSILDYISKYVIKSNANDKAKEFQAKLYSFNKIYKASTKRKYNVFEILIVNLAFELHYLYDFVCDSDEINFIFNNCSWFIKNMIENDIEKAYYQNAIYEISTFYKLTKDITISSNSIPKNDLAYREWCTISVCELGKFCTKWQEKNCMSFIAKYMVINGLEVSSGERALLNFSSRIEMFDYLFELEGRTHYKPRENILIFFDEIDLYVHPNAQKKLISTLLKQVNSLFHGHNVQIIISSHSPIVLSDIPSENTTYLIKSPTENTIVRDGRGQQQTFASNIPSLYRNGFFIEGGIGVGDYALDLINSVAKQLKNKTELTKEESSYYCQIIALIGEPILRHKLEEMLSAFRSHNAHLQYKTRVHIPQNEKNEYLNFLRRQRALIDEEIRRLECGNND